MKNISKLLNDPITKPWLSFLSNILDIFDEFNILLQTSSTSLIHKIQGETARLLRTVLSFFVSPDVLLNSGENLASIDYTSSSNHLLHESVYIGDDTTALLLQVQGEEQKTEPFYRAVIAFYTAFIKKLQKVHNLRSLVWPIFAGLDPHQSRNITVGLLDEIEKEISILLDKSQVKLEVVDPEIDTTQSDAIKFWLDVSTMESPLGERKSHILSNLALSLLSIPASNADSERVFSQVRRIKTDFRASLSTKTHQCLHSLGVTSIIRLNAASKENSLLLF